MKDFKDYIVNNKYVIICVAIVVILYALGIVDFLTKLVVLCALLVGAIFLGKKLQDNEGKIKNIFNYIKNKEYKNEVYYYQNTKNDDKK